MCGLKLRTGLHKKYVTDSVSVKLSGLEQPSSVMLTLFLTSLSAPLIKILLHHENCLK